VMKNDGTRMFVISGQDVVHLRSWPAPQMQEVARTTITGSRPIGLLLIRGGVANSARRLVVLSQQYSFGNAIPAPSIAPQLGTLPPPCMDCRYPDTGKTVVSVYDVNNATQPSLLKTFEVQGSLIAARMIDDNLRMVSSRNFQWPAGLEWVPPVPSAPGRATPTGAVQPWEPWGSLAERTAAFNASIAKNEGIIRAAPLSQWVPSGFANSECTNVMAPNTTSAMGWVTLSTLDLIQPTVNQTVFNQHVLTEPGLVYASLRNLHLVTRHWYSRTAAAQTDTSYVHRFAMPTRFGFELAASGTFEGHLNDDFSIDEADNGDLRAAVQLSRWQTNAGRFERKLSSRMLVLRANAAKLEQIGQTPELAAGETIQSARIFGNRGFVVTFRQVDPLFTFDLSDGRNPRVMGELKVPGFSTYLHPIDANTLLGLGTFLPEPDANGRIDFSQRRVQLSLFDVSNMAAPKQTANVLVGSVSATSAALFDHKAFTYLASAQRVALPFFDFGPPAIGFGPYSNATSSLRVFDIDAAAGANAIKPRGAIEMSTALRSTTAAQSSAMYTPWITRSVLADDIVYAVSEAAVASANVSALNVPISTVKLLK
jgi:hypothetical protein